MSILCRNCGNNDQAQFRMGGTLEGTEFKRYRCKKCGKWGNTGDTKEMKDPVEEDVYTFIDEGETAFASASLDYDVINSTQKLMEVMKIDDKVWEIYKKQVGKAPAWRKDRIVEWDVEDGQVTHGHVDDTGKIKVIPVYTVKLWLRRKTEEIRANLFLEDFKKTAYQFAPKTVHLKYPKPNKSNLLYEIEMPDIHIGRLTWGEESGLDSDLKSQVEMVRKVATELLAYTEKFPIAKILFPIGHDYYNVDNNLNTTTHGTPQQEDTRWRKSFKVGWELAAELTNMFSQVAPVDIWVIGGNHDEQRSFYLGEVLSALYANSKRVTINNSAKLRKYYQWGSCMIGMTHGYHERLKELKDLMSYEEPKMWAETKYREFHTGDKHHKEDYVHKTQETNGGVVIRILRSLSTADAWHYNKGYVGALRASEAFLWDAEMGLKAQFTAIP